MKTLITLVLIMLVGCDSSQPTGNNNNTTNNSINNTNNTSNNTNSTNNTTCILGDAVGSPCSSECTCISVNGLTCNPETNLCEFSIDCGNGTIDGTETCDGTDLGGNTCEALGFSGGVPTCNTCELDTLSCECGEGYIYEPTLNLCHVDTTTTQETNCWGIDTLSNFNCYWEFCDGEATITKTGRPSRQGQVTGDPEHCGDCDTVCSSVEECVCRYIPNESIPFHTTCECE